MSNFIGKFSGVLNFDANLLASKFGVFCSKIAAANAPTEVVSTEKLFSLGFSEYANVIIGLVFKLFFYICRFILNLVDGLEMIVNKLSGIKSTAKYDINADFNDNIIFKFLFHETTLRIISILIGASIILVIVFVIIGLVKADYDAATNDKDGSKGPVIRRGFKSLFLFVTFPMILFVFVISTNAILSSVNAAFRGSTNYSGTLGGTIFISSAYESNKYRNYAKTGARTQILFDFDDPVQSGLSKSLTTEELVEIYDSWVDAKYIYNSFAYRDFASYSDTIVYRNGKVYNAANYGNYENFVTTAEEYFVLADFIDYAVTNQLEYYIKAMDDKDIDWEAVKSQIGAAMYYSIVNNNKFSIAYSDEFNIDKNGETNSYVREYVNSLGTASTPLADAIKVAEMILGVGDYTDNTFKVLERVPGHINYVRWASEMALDSYTGEKMRVYEIVKYTYNTTLEEIQEREPQLCVQKNSEYFAVKRLSDEEIAANGGEYYYFCNTNNDASKIDRVSVDHKLVYDNGEEYLNQYGEAIIMPKDKLSVKYKLVSWPEKLYNDLLVVFGDVFRSKIASENDDWISMETNSSDVLISEDGLASLPTAFISPSGLIMSELFLGTRLETEEGIAAASATYGSVYSESVLEAIIKTVAGENDYFAIKAQITAFEAIFDNMMAAVLDSVAELEAVLDVDDSVSMNTYKQYLASIMMSDEFAEYFGKIARKVVGFNEVLNEMTNGPVIPKYTGDNGLSSFSQLYIENELLPSLEDGSLTKEFILSYINGQFSCYDDSYSAAVDKSSFVYEGWDPVKVEYYVRSAKDVSLSGVDLEEYYEKLKQSRNIVYSDFVNADSSNLNLVGTLLTRLKNCDNELFSFYKYVIKTAFRDAITFESTNGISVTLNDNTYNVLLTLSTTQIAEYAFGNQLLKIAPEYYSSDSDFLFVEPGYTGIMNVQGEVVINENHYEVKYSDETGKYFVEIDNIPYDVVNGYCVEYAGNNYIIKYRYINPFKKLFDFVKDFGDIAIELNSSSFVDMAYGAVNNLFGDNFDAAFVNYLYEEILPEFPDLLRTTGLVNLGDIGINQTDVINWQIVSFETSENDDGKFISLEVELNYVSGTEQNVENGIVGLTKQTSEAPFNDNNLLVQTFVEFWGMDFKRSTVGFVYDVITENNRKFAVVDGVRYDCISVEYSGIAGDNSLIFEDGNNSIIGTGIEFLNGKTYLVDENNNTVIIGSEKVGKTLIDYRRDAMAIIAQLETRPGETDFELADRFLSMLYLMTAEVDDGDKIRTDIYSKRIIKQLAGEENRPDSSLIGKVYSVDFDSALKDENNGTVFIMCEYDEGLEKYVPLLVTNDMSDFAEFRSAYVANPYGSGRMYYPIVARGIIDDNGNPTAIRMTRDGDIEFYRNDIYIVNASHFNMGMYYQTLEDVRVKKSVVSTIVNGITKMFSGKTLTQMVLEKIPRVSADANLHFAYGNRTTVVGSVKNGDFAMSYNFQPLGIDAFYSTKDLNMIILLVGTVMIFGALMAAAVGLIQRIWDIVVLFVLAPPVIASVANDDKRFGKWRDKFVSSVLSVYGIVIGLNVFFIFVPIVTSMNVVDSSSAILKTHLGAMVGKEFINMMFRVIFLLTLVGLIRRAPALMQPLISGGKDEDIFKKGEKTQKNIRDAIDTTKDIMSGQYAIDKAHKLIGDVKHFIPGYGAYELAKKVKRKVADKKIAKADGDTAKNAMNIALANGVSKDVAKEAAENLKKAYEKLREAEKEARDRQKKEREEREKARAEREKISED